MMIRKPAVAGQFYPASGAMLEKEISSYIDKNAERETCLGAVSPHAGYIYSGCVAGKVFSKINLTETFIIMGPNHTGNGKQFSIVTKGSWQLPKGNIDIDGGLADNLLTRSKHLEEDTLAHNYEHSIEVQLPFIQYFKKNFKFVPIVVSHSTLAIYRELGKEIAKTIKDSGKKIVIVASSDMTHYEEHKSAEKKDKLAIEAILNLDEKSLLDTISKYNISMCGYAPTIVMLAATKELGAKKAELVDYKTSGDVSGDYSSVVGYAGIIIK